MGGRDMRFRGSVLIPSVAIALIGGFAAGISVNSLVEDKHPDPPSTIRAPNSESNIEPDRVPPLNTPEALASEIEDPILNIESIVNSTEFASDFDQSFALYTLLSRAGVDDLSKLIEDSFAISSINQRIAALSIIFGRYAAIDPNEALKRALALNHLTSREKANVFRAIFNEWTVGDLDAAISVIGNLPEQAKFFAASAVLQRSDFLSPDQRIQLVRRIGPNGIWIGNAIASISSDAARDDPRNAFYDQIREMGHSQIHYAELLGIARHWIDLEGIAILPEIYESLPSNAAKRYVLRGLVTHAIGMRSDEPATVLDVVALLPNAQDARRATEHAFQSWSNHDPKESFEASIEFGDDLVTPKFRASLLQIWATKNPKTLLTNASALPQEYQDTAVVKALGRMSTNTPEEAIRYARNLETRPLRILARDEILTRWSSVDAKSAFEWLMEDGFDGSHRSNPSIWREIFEKYLDQDIDAADTFASNYQGTLRKNLIASVADHLVHSDVERAIAYVPKVEDWYQHLLQERIGKKLILLDKNRAMTYGASLEDSLQRRYFRSVINEWAYRDLLDLTQNIQLVPPEFRPFAAKEALGWNEEKGYLSDHQITKLKAMTPSEAEVEELIVTSGGC